MRKILFQINVSLDGYITGPHGEMDWFVWDDELGQQAIDILESSDLILLGRNLAEEFLEYWPTDTSDFAELINSRQKIVFSKSIQVRWPNVSVIRGNIVAEIMALKQQPGANMVLYGGAELARTFIKHNLIDEYHLFVNPVVMGGGLQLFDTPAGKMDLKLVRSRATSAGAVMLCYRRRQEVGVRS